MSKVKVELDGVVQEVKERYLNRFLEKGWTEVSNTSPKKLSKNKIKVDADVEQVVETEPVQEELILPINPPTINQGE